MNIAVIRSCASILFDIFPDDSIFKSITRKILRYRKYRTISTRVGDASHAWSIYCAIFARIRRWGSRKHHQGLNPSPLLINAVQYFTDNRIFNILTSTILYWRKYWTILIGTEEVRDVRFFSELQTLEQSYFRTDSVMSGSIYWTILFAGNIQYIEQCSNPIMGTYWTIWTGTGDLSYWTSIYWSVIVQYACNRNVASLAVIEQFLFGYLAIYCAMRGMENGLVWNIDSYVNILTSHDFSTSFAPDFSAVATDRDEPGKKKTRTMFHFETFALISVSFRVFWFGIFRNEPKSRKHSRTSPGPGASAFAISKHAQFKITVHCRLRWLNDWLTNCFVVVANTHNMIFDLPPRNSAAQVQPSTQNFRKFETFCNSTALGV